MRWYADNSELHGIRGADIPDILLFGGVAVPAHAERGLHQALEGIKKKHGAARAPVKWNFKNLGPEYKKQNQEKLFETLLASSGEWRSQMFEEAAKHDIQVIVSVIETLSVKKDKIKDAKATLSGFAFANGLMRYGLCVADAKPEHAQVMLDWPDKHDSEPFTLEYQHAYARGRSSGGQEYYCGALQSIGFLDSVAYTTMVNSTLLQFADLVVGATREVVNCALGKGKEGLGVNLSKSIKHRYYGAPTEIFGRGINVASRNERLKAQLRDYLKATF